MILIIFINGKCKLKKCYLGTKNRLWLAPISGKTNFKLYTLFYNERGGFIGVVILCWSASGNESTQKNLLWIIYTSEVRQTIYSFR